jgi:hypothetical protein
MNGKTLEIISKLLTLASALARSMPLSFVGGSNDRRAHEGCTPIGSASGIVR